MSHLYVFRVSNILLPISPQFFKVFTPKFPGFVPRNEDPTVAMGDGGGVWAPPGDAWEPSSNHEIFAMVFFLMWPVESICQWIR